MLNIKLRPYQIEAKEACINDLDTSGRSLLVMSTGTGKSNTGYSIVNHYYSLGKKILFTVHKLKLVEQVLKQKRKIFKDVGAICGSLNEPDRMDAQVTVGSIQTLARREDLPQWDLIVIDESHRYSEKKESQYNEFISSQEQAAILGMTATDYNLDGYIHGENKLWPDVTYKKDLLWAVEEGWLVRPKIKHTNEQFDTSKLHTKLGDFDQSEVKALASNVEKVKAQIIDALPKIQGRNKVVWHCTCIDHAMLVRRLLEQAGEQVVSIHSKMAKSEQDLAIKDFEETSETRHLVFVMIVSEGYDYPPADAYVWMRPTKSPVLYVQGTGRVLRPIYADGFDLETREGRLAAIASSNKPDALVLDYGQVVLNCGPLDNPYIRGKRGRVLNKDESSEMKFCPQCLEYQKKQEPVCVDCGYDFIEALLKAQQDRLKNLTKTTTKEVNILSSRKERVKSNNDVHVSIDPFLTKACERTSKSGNRYIAIDYWVEDLGKNVTEFFTFGTNRFQVENNYKKLSLYLKYPVGDLRKKPLSNIVEMLNKRGFEHVDFLILATQDKWVKVKKVLFNDREKNVVGNQ